MNSPTTENEQSEMKGVKGSCWSITINNPSAADDEQIALLQTKKWFRKWEGQIERGEKDGTPHIQACLHTEYIRWAAIKKVLRRAHIERARKETDLVKYVHKSDTRVAELDTAERVGPQHVEQHIYKKIIKLLTRESRGNSAWSEEYLRDVMIGSETNGDLMVAFKRIDPMTIFDEVVSDLIAEGAQLEMWASNPLVRSGYKKYFHAIVIRNARREKREDVDDAASSSAPENSQQDESSETASLD